MAKSSTKLSSGSLEKIIFEEPSSYPVYWEVLAITKLEPAGLSNAARYNLHLSDGVASFKFGILDVHLNHLVESKKLMVKCIIRVTFCAVSVARRSRDDERRYILIKEMSIEQPVEDGPAAPSTAQPEEGPTAEGQIKSLVVEAQDKQPPKITAPLPPSATKRKTVCIDSLSPYNNKWVIRARVMSKSAIRTWSNAKGDGKLFSFDLCDETGEIRATAFRDQSDKYYDFLEVDKVYYISKCQLKPANKQFSKLKNYYEMTLGPESIIQECTDVGQIPAIKYDFVTINDVANMKAGEFIDIIGLCKGVSDLVNFTSREGRDLTKREVTFVDQSNASIVLTLWGEEAKNFDGHDQPILLVKGAKIGELGGGKTIGTTSASTIKFNPDLPEGHKLREWFVNGGLAGDVKHISSRTQGNFAAKWMNFHDAKLKNLGGGDKADYYQVCGFIHTVRIANAFYKACPQEGCQKKVVDQENGTYRCDKCNIESPNFKFRLLVNMLVGDWTSNRWVTLFSDQAEVMFGKTAHEIGTMIENDKNGAQKLFNSVQLQQKVFQLRSKVETYQDIPKSKISVVNVNEVIYKDLNKHLLNNIQRLTGI